MDSDSDTDFFSEKSIKNKLRKLLKCANRSQSQEDSTIVLGSPIDSLSTHGLDPDETVRVIFPKESIDVHRFSIQRTDSFSSVFKQLSELRRVPFDHIELVIMPQHRIVSQYDCLDSLDYSPTSFFHAFLKVSTNILSESKGTGNVVIKCVTNDKKIDPMVYKLFQDQPLDILMAYCSRDLNLDRRTFKLIFDGELIKPFDTCSSLDIMSGETVEIHFLL